MKVIKISDNVYEMLYSIASKRQISINQLIADIINVYLGGRSDKGIKQVVDKDITLLYDDKCDKCGKQLRAGDRAHFIKYIYEDDSSKSTILCVDCFINSDPLLYKKYVKVKEYEILIKQLKQEADRLVNEVRKAEIEANLVSVKREVINLWKDISFYLKNYNDVSKYEELLSKLEDIINKVSGLEAMLKSQVLVKPKQKKVFLR